MLQYLDIDEFDVNTVHLKIAKNVKKIRKKKNFSQEELALSIGHSSASMIGKIEAGLENKHYNIKQLYLIAQILNVPMKSFFENV
ncbi:MAG: helix-turn-helix transcriptional regulator [Arcobacteraceae bacterium]|jgi:transcriptional regulator with XRE-family HTH domain|nr:helix-turn-helix transcriptional regulator [Arcobacteraceae bacterium]